MSFVAPWALILSVSAVLVVLGAAAGRINRDAWVSEPLICTALGVAVGPLGLGLVYIRVGHDMHATLVMRETARITLAVAVTGSAMRLPSGWLRRNWRGMAIVLGPLMLGMWGLGTLITGIVLHLPALRSLLVGAAITPTDPVLAAPVVSGRLAEDNIPENLRMGITAESGANDGLALPFVMLPILLMRHPAGQAFFDWAVHVLLREIAAGVALGAAAG